MAIPVGRGTVPAGITGRVPVIFRPGQEPETLCPDESVERAYGKETETFLERWFRV